MIDAALTREKRPMCFVIWPDWPLPLPPLNPPAPPPAPSEHPDEDFVSHPDPSVPQNIPSMPHFRPNVS